MAKHQSDTSPSATEEELRILPYERVSQLFIEYLNHCKDEKTHPLYISGKSTFFNAWHLIKKENKVRLSRGKERYVISSILRNS